MLDARTTLAVPLALAAAAAPALCSDLKLDGQTSITTTLGGTISMDLTGGSLLPASIAADVSPGPITFAGESVPIGLTGLFQVVATGATDATGLYNAPLTIPTSPGIDGLTLHFVGVVFDPGDPNGFDFSNAAKTLLQAASGGFEEADVVGITRPVYPHFDWVTTFNEGDDVEVGIDPSATPSIVGKTGDVYVTVNKTDSQWDADPSLVDVSGDGANTFAFNGVDLQSNVLTVDTGNLSGSLGGLPGMGVPYDVVVDLNQNGTLDAGDLIDGYGPQAAFYVAHDLTQPGPYAVTEWIYSAGPNKDQDVYFPSNIADLGLLPLVVISHGNGHNYQWYDHIGFHLASHGYIVMSHFNNTVPGIETASTTTLENTDAFVGNTNLLPGPAAAIDGHLDTSSITWIGHSRGGEGVVRAYDRIVDGTFVPNNYTADDIVLISSIAPTDFLGTNSATPHDKKHHLWIGAADSDVSGCTSSNVTQSRHLSGRAEDQRQSITLYGVGHAWFHDNGGTPWASGPCLLNENLTHQIQLGYLLPLVEYHVKDNPAALDFLWRQYEDLHPIGAPVGNPCTRVAITWRDEAASGRFVIDAFQANTDDNLADSGATISTTVNFWDTGRLDDPDTNFTHAGSETFNGFTDANNTDPDFGAVIGFGAAGDYSVTYDLAGGTDWTGFDRLSFRACQVTRHPLTTGELADTTFSVRVTDGDGDSSTQSISASGAGIVEPYQRSGCGSGVGWGNEWETIRLGIRGFTVNNPNLDLDDIDTLEFLFGASHGSSAGRLGLDDIALEN